MQGTKDSNWGAGNGLRPKDRIERSKSTQLLYILNGAVTRIFVGKAERLLLLLLLESLRSGKPSSTELLNFSTSQPTVQ